MKIQMSPSLTIHRCPSKSEVRDLDLGASAAIGRPETDKVDEPELCIRGGGAAAGRPKPDKILCFFLLFDDSLGSPEQKPLPFIS